MRADKKIVKWMLFNVKHMILTFLLFLGIFLILNIPSNFSFVWGQGKAHFNLKCECFS